MIINIKFVHGGTEVQSQVEPGARLYMHRATHDTAKHGSRDLILYPIINAVTVIGLAVPP